MTPRVTAIAVPDPLRSPVGLFGAALAIAGSALAVFTLGGGFQLLYRLGVPADPVAWALILFLGIALYTAGMTLTRKASPSFARWVAILTLATIAAILVAQILLSFVAI